MRRVSSTAMSETKTESGSGDSGSAKSQRRRADAQAFGYKTEPATHACVSISWMDDEVRATTNRRSCDGRNFATPPLLMTSGASSHDVQRAFPLFFINDGSKSKRYTLRPPGVSARRVTNHARLLSSPRVSTATAPGLKSIGSGKSHSMMCAEASRLGAVLLDVVVLGVTT